jgi:hypothetical protein
VAFLHMSLPRAQGLTRLIHPILVCAFREQRASLTAGLKPSDAA